ncbi:MAG: 2-hydroxyacid dehydrogenase [Clostridia bacterium]|nr:2-hydroxyacid dehydrogenase [Clostridia bacterium]
MSWNITLFDAKEYDINSFNGFKDKYDVVYKYYDTRLTEDTVSLCKGSDVVCVFVNDQITDRIIDALQEYGIKLLALRCSGYNNVDIEYAFGKLHIVRVPAYSPHAVAEHAMAMLLTSVRRIHKAYIRTRDFNFSLNGLTGFNLYGKTVGIIGTGRIGKCFADICLGFGMKVLAFDKTPANNPRITYTTLNEIWKKSDIISLHCPLNEETLHLINKSTLKKMKKGIVIINTSRGALIDSKALLNSIKTRHVGAACLDVYEEEANLFFRDLSGHIIDDDILARLISMPNVIVSSHQAFLTEEALYNIAETTLNNINEFMITGTSKNEICYKCSQFNECKGKSKGKCF